MNIPSRFRFPGRLLFACAFAVPLVSSISHGQTVPDADAIYPLAPVTVTARRVAEDASDVPAYLQVITSRQIEDSNATNLIDLLEDEANIQFCSLSGSPTNTSVSLRGTSGGAAGGNGRTLILLDGVAANRIDMGQFNWLQFSLQNIDSIEVIQGPQGAFYGDNAVGGVIKITTRGAPQASGGNAQVLVGSDGTFKASAGYTQLLDANWWASVSTGYDTSGGWRDHSGYKDTSGALSLGYDNHKNSTTQVNISLLDSTYDQPGYLTYAQYHQDPTQEGQEATNGWSDYRQVTVKNTFGFSPQAQLITDGGVNLVKEYYNGTYGQFNRSMDDFSLSPKLHLETGAFTFTPGIDASYNWLHAVTTAPVDSLLSRTTISPFLTGQWRVSDTLAFSAAYRHEWNKIVSRERVGDDEGSRLAGGDAYELAVNYKPVAGLHVYAKYDRTYRFPATDEISYYQGFAGGPGGTVFFNPDLKPEVSDNYEIGGDFSRRGWSAGASVYYLETHDEIFYNSSDFLNENLAKTRRTGAQLNAGYDAGGVFGLRTRADYVDARLLESTPGAGLIDSGPIRMTPALRLTTTGVARPFQGLELSLTHTYVGSSYVDDSYASSSPGRVAGVSLFDAKINYRLNKNWRLFAGVNNIFNTTYVSYSDIGYPAPSYAATTVYYPGQGRFVYAGSSVKF